MKLYEHPRIVELRLSQIYDKIKLIEPNEIKALEGLMLLIEFLEVPNGYELKDLFQLDYKIKKFQFGTNEEVLKYRQEHILAASLYGVSKREVSSYIIPLSESSLYRPAFQVHTFLTEDFIEDLDNSVEVLHSDRLRKIGLDFLVKYHRMKERLNVSTSST